MKKTVAVILVLAFMITIFMPGVAGAAEEATQVFLAPEEFSGDPADETEADLPPEFEATPETDQSIVEHAAVEEGQPEGEQLAQADGEIGSERIFKIAGSIFVSDAAAVLAAKSDKALIYVVRSDSLSSYKDFYPDGTTENARAKEVALRFDEMYNLVSSPGTPNFFAQPYNINGDGRVIILLCDIANDGRESGGTVGGYVSGLFYSADFTSHNSAAMIYADVAPNQGYSKLKGDPDSFYQTIMHEYAHLLSFSCVYTNRLAGKNPVFKNVFAEEAFAELAAYIYKNKFSSGKLGAFFSGQFKPGYGFLDWQYGVDVYGNASFGAAVLVGLAYYNNGGNINSFLMDPRGGNTDTFIAMGDHAAGSGNTTNLANFNEFFNKFALDTYVSDPSKAGPHIKNVSFDSWNMIDLYNQPVLKPDKDFAFSANISPYMPKYFVIPRMGERLPTDANVVKVTLTDANARSRFYVVYPSEPFSGLQKASRREYKELIPGREITIPVGQGNDFAVFAVNLDYSNTNASIRYNTAKDTDYPYTDVQVPEVTALKAEHAQNNVVISWSAPQNVPSAITLNSYEVYRDGERLGSLSASASSLSRTDYYSNLEEGRSYEYTVKTVATLAGGSAKISSAGASTVFKLLPITVAMPQNISATSVNDGKSIRIEWEKAPAVFGEIRQMAPSGYEIYRDDTLIYSPGASYTSYTDTGLEPGITHSYIMRSKYTSSGKTVYSDYTPKVTVIGMALNPPQNLKAVQSGKNISLSWAKPASGATPENYSVYRNGNKIATAYGLSYNDENPAPGTYSYYVTSVSGSYESPASNTVSIKVGSISPKRSQFTYSLTAKAYTGGQQGVTVAPKSGVGRVTAVYYTGTSGTSYKKTTAKPKNIGSYKVTVDVGAGTKYAAAKNIVIGTFKINPKKLATPKIELRAKQMYVNWVKASSAQNVSGYQVRYREAGSSAWKTRTCKASSSSTAFTAITWGKSYQVQVRSYKKVGGTNHYSEWSNTASSGVIWF